MTYKRIRRWHVSYIFGIPGSFIRDSSRWHDNSIKNSFGQRWDSRPNGCYGRPADLRDRTTSMVQPDIPSTLGRMLLTKDIRCCCSPAAIADACGTATAPYHQDCWLETRNSHWYLSHAKIFTDRGVLWPRMARISESPDLWSIDTWLPDLGSDRKTIQILISFILKTPKPR